METTQTDVAWFAGLFEGEGSLSRCRPGRGAWRLSLRMTDEDVIRRIATLFGGAVYASSSRVPNHKDHWLWQEGHQDRINLIVSLIYPFMGTRRRATMDEFLAYYAVPAPSNSERSRRNWDDPDYRSRMSRVRKALWADEAWRARELQRRADARAFSATVS